VIKAHKKMKAVHETMNEITLMNNRSNSTNNSTTLASIYITNLAKYNAGELVGKWFGLPSTEE